MSKNEKIHVENFFLSSEEKKLFCLIVKIIMESIKYISSIHLLSLCLRIFQTYLKARLHWESARERERAIFHPSIHFPNDHSRGSEARLKSEARNPGLVTHITGNAPRACTILHCPPGQISRELDQKHSRQDSNWCLNEEQVLHIMPQCEPLCLTVAKE